MNKKQRQIATLVTVSGILILAIALIALIYNIVTLASLTARRDALLSKSRALAEAIENDQDEIEYRNSAEYVEKYARDYLNMQFEGEEVYESE